MTSEKAKILPHCDEAPKKIKKEFPVLWKRFGGATALFFTLMYAVIGF